MGPDGNGTSPRKLGKSLGGMSVPQITRILAWKLQDVPFGSGAKSTFVRPPLPTSGEIRPPRPVGRRTRCSRTGLRFAALPNRTSPALPPGSGRSDGGPHPAPTGAGRPLALDPPRSPNPRT